MLYKEQLLNFFNTKKESLPFDLKDEADVSLQTQQSIDDSFGGLIRDNSVLTIDQLAELTEQSVEVILRELTMLEFAEKIYQDKPGYSVSK